MQLFVDTETTGFASGGVQPRIVSFAWIFAEHGAAPRHAGYAVVRPDGFEIPWGAARVHGITTERALDEGRPVAAVMAEFTADLARFRPQRLIAHNLAYDLPVLMAEFARLGEDFPCIGMTTDCTMLRARRHWPGESARLGEVHRRLLGEEMADAHHAGADAWACARIWFALQQRPRRVR